MGRGKYDRILISCMKIDRFTFLPKVIYPLEKLQGVFQILKQQKQKSSIHFCILNSLEKRVMLNR